MRSESSYSDCFNPTLVRLRPVFVVAAEEGLLEFQSHAGSIEALHSLDDFAPQEPCFNPTLVRLRPWRPISRSGSASPFQSHAGSIEANGRPFALRIRAVVSIPRWFD